VAVLLKKYLNRILIDELAVLPRLAAQAIAY
jgi:hypothetical protein